MVKMRWILVWNYQFSCEICKKLFQYDYRKFLTPEDRSDQSRRKITVEFGLQVHVQDFAARKILESILWIEQVSENSKFNMLNLAIPVNFGLKMSDF